MNLSRNTLTGTLPTDQQLISNVCNIDTAWHRAQQHVVYLGVCRGCQAVGGSMLYLRSLTLRLVDMSAAGVALIARLPALMDLTLSGFAASALAIDARTPSLAGARHLTSLTLYDYSCYSHGISSEYTSIRQPGWHIDFARELYWAFIG